MYRLIAAIFFLSCFAISPPAYANSPSEWAREQVETAERLGIGYAEPEEPYTRQLTRAELAYVGVNLFRILGANNLVLNEADKTNISAKFYDSYYNGALFSDEIFIAIKYELMNGTSVETFSPELPVTREQTATVLYRIAEKSNAVFTAEPADLGRFTDHGKISPYAFDSISMMVSENILSGKSADTIEPLLPCTYEEVLVIAVRFWERFGASARQSENAENNAENNVDSPENAANDTPVDNNTYSWDYYSYDWEMDLYGADEHNARGIKLRRYSSNAEALNDMQSVTVNVWSLGSDGSKKPSKKSFLVHKDVVEDVIGIFDEIFSGDEQFPIQSVGGYSWRGAGSTSSHVNGLAIDINPEQNYFVDMNGRVLSGQFWKPYENPYSITPDGDVVSAFRNKGWFWAGEGWSTTGYDYMHFSYTGV